MIKRRQFFKYASLSTVGFAFAVKGSALAQSPAEQTSQALSNLKTFSFRVPTINARGQLRDTHRNYAQFFSEHLSDSAQLEMVAIASGQFVMGASQAEPSGRTTEFPRHRVKIQQPFFMSKSPITQGQWATVAALPKVKRDLNPDPSHFQGKDRPVESISWLDAVEFCERLSQLTHRHYHLPSEAQWEYACRAGTHTPFNTGATIISDWLIIWVLTPIVRRYKASIVKRQFQWAVLHLMLLGCKTCTAMFGNGVQIVGIKVIGVPPSNAKPWTSRSPFQSKVIRGGSWLDAPTKLRSASRSGYSATSLNRIIGFRVSCTKA